MLGLRQIFLLVLLFALVSVLLIMINLAIPKSSPRKLHRNLHYNSSKVRSSHHTSYGDEKSAGRLPNTNATNGKAKKKLDWLIKGRQLMLQKEGKRPRTKKAIAGSHPLKRLKFEKADYPQLLNTNPGGVFKNLSWQLDSTQDGVCDGNSSFILAVVPSTVGNVRERQLIRDSWGSKDIFLYTRLTTVFLVGATADSVLQRKVVEEGFKYNDIIQMNYLDSYRNLTYKTMTALMWISENCPDIPWILKVDDDVLLNPFTLRIYLENELALNPSPSTIYGRLRARSSPFRNGKWSVALEEYPNKYYPRFVLGSAYIIGRNAIEKLIQTTPSTPFLYLEDVYFTGIVSKKAGIGLTNIEFNKFTRRATFSIISGNAIFLVGATANIRKHIWKKVLLSKPDLT